MQLRSPIDHFPLTFMLKVVSFSDRMLQVGPFQISWVLPNAVHRFLHDLRYPGSTLSGFHLPLLHPTSSWVRQTEKGLA